MMLDVAGGVLIAASICALLAFGVFLMIEEDPLGKRSSTKWGWGLACICLSIVAAIWIVLI